MRTKHLCSECGEGTGFVPIPGPKLRCLNCGAEFTWDEWSKLKRGVKYE